PHFESRAFYPRDNPTRRINYDQSAWSSRVPDWHRIDGFRDGRGTVECGGWMLARKTHQAGEERQNRYIVGAHAESLVRHPEFASITIRVDHQLPHDDKRSIWCGSRCLFTSVRLRLHIAAPAAATWKINRVKDRSPR